MKRAIEGGIKILFKKSSTIYKKFLSLVDLISFADKVIYQNQVFFYHFYNSSTHVRKYLYESKFNANNILY